MTTKLEKMRRHLRQKSLAGDAPGKTRNRKGYRVIRTHNGRFALMALDYKRRTEGGAFPMTTVDTYTNRAMAKAAGESLREAGLLQT